MVAFAAVVLAFAAIGVAVVIAAFATRRKASDAPPSRAANGVLYTGVLLVVVGIGLGLPLLLLVGNADKADRATVGGVDLTASEAKGRELFAKNCATCHSLRASNAVGRTGPNLDVLRPPAGLTENAILLGRARGNGNMPVGLLSGQDAKDVAEYVAAVAGTGNPGAPVATAAVR